MVLNKLLRFKNYLCDSARHRDSAAQWDVCSPHLHINARTPFRNTAASWQCCCLRSGVKKTHKSLDSLFNALDSFFVLWKTVKQGHQVPFSIVLLCFQWRDWTCPEPRQTDSTRTLCGKAASLEPGSWDSSSVFMDLGPVRRSLGSKNQREQNP